MSEEVTERAVSGKEPRMASERFASWAGRWGGIAAMAGGALFIASSVVQASIGTWFGGSPFEGSPVGHAVYHSLDAPAFALLGFGLLGLYLRYGERFALPERAVFFLTLAAMALTALLAVGILLVEGAVLGAFVEALHVLHSVVFPLATASILIGSVLCGASVLRADIPPRAGPLLLVVGPLLLMGVVFFAGTQSSWLFSAPQLLWGAGWVWLGYGLWSKKASSI